MISYIFFIFAAICNSVMDCCSFHYNNSVFTKFNTPMYWDSSVSWKAKYVDGDPSKGMKKWFFGLFDMPVAFTDSFHAFKSGMIVFIVLGIVCYSPFLGDILLRDVVVTNCWKYILERLIDFVILGTLWNIFFSWFFNKIFVLKK